MSYYNGATPTSARGAVGSGWFKWKNGGTNEVWLAFLFADYDKKYVSYRKTQTWTSFGVERNFYVIYDGEDSDGRDVWKRGVCNIDPCGGTELQVDTVKFDNLEDSTHPRISSWTTHSSVQLATGGLAASFRDWKMFGTDHVWKTPDGFGPYCTTDSPYYVHQHSANPPALHHMGPPTPAGESDSSGICSGSTGSIFP
jgi:hypothetical protein